MKKVYLCLLMVGLMGSLLVAKPVTVNMSLGETYTYKLASGEEKKIKVISYFHEYDKYRQAIRKTTVTVEVDGVRAEIGVALCNMPRVVNGVKLDAVVTKMFSVNSGDPLIWNLGDADVRLRFWDPDQPLLEPGTFVYPLKQRWSAGGTQVTNEVDGDSHYDLSQEKYKKNIYYHYSLDFGGYEGRVQIVSATDGEVVSARGKSNQKFDAGLAAGAHYAKARGDVIYILDDRGWYYRYSHLDSILPNVQVGKRVKKGEWLGIMGRKGDSGGWSHLHFGIHGSKGDECGVINAYPFVVEAYIREHPGCLLAVARPHLLVEPGKKAVLDGSNSICDGGKIVSYEWEFHDGTKGHGAVVEKVYPNPGTYCEILRVKDDRGQVAVDFAEVHVPNNGKGSYIDLSYYPTEGISVGDEVYFKVKAFRIKGGEEKWDFGDGGSGVTHSNSALKGRGKGHATISHYYEKPGLYVVKVHRIADDGRMTIRCVAVEVD